MVIASAPSVRSLWAFARERERIRLLRVASEPPPWTQDEVLRRFHFCNVRRADDAGTRWYMEHTAHGFPDGQPEEAIFQTVLYRLVNSPSWCDKVGAISLGDWYTTRDACARRIRAGPAPYSPAYLTFGGGPAQRGVGRRERLIQALDSAAYWSLVLADYVDDGVDLPTFWGELQKIDFIGPFTAMQVYRDLFLAGALPSELDEDSFVYLGPGCRPGLALLGAEGYGEQLTLLQRLWKRQPKGPWGGRLTLADVEHLVCEARKYWNLRAGHGKRRYYRNRTDTSRRSV